MARPTPDERVASGELFFLPVHEKNVNMFKKILEVTLPVAYDEKFLKTSITQWPDFQKLLYFKDIPVGVIGARIETEGTTKRLYIAVIGVLAAYRGRGLGEALLHEELKALSKHPDVSEVYIHVHVGNEDAVKFYTRQGFTRDPEPLAGYYDMHRAVPEPKDAYVFRKAVNSGAAKKQ